jgi:DNA-binding beta-propeller fold protein YncE
VRTRLVLIALPLLSVPNAANSRWERPTHPSGRACVRVTGFSGRPFGVHVTRAGDIIVTVQDVGRIIHLDSLLQPKSYLGVGEDPGDVIANRAGTVAYISAFAQGTIAVLDVSADSVVEVIQLPTRNAYRLALSPNESKLYVTSTDGRLFVMDTHSRDFERSKLLGGALQGLALDHAAHNLYVSSTAGEIWRLDQASLRTKRRANLNCVAQDVALSNDDAELYVACEEGTVVVLDPISLETTGVIPVPTGSAFALAVTPDNAQLYVSSPAIGEVAILDRASHKPVWNVYVKGRPRRIAFNAHGDKAYVTNEWNWVNIIR